MSASSSSEEAAVSASLLSSSGNNNNNNNETDFVLNADGSILIDHKGVSRIVRYLNIVFSITSIELQLTLLQHYCISPTTSQEAVSVQRFLCTKPLRSEVSTRKGKLLLK